MQCQKCGYQLQAALPACPRCNNPLPYNVQSPPPQYNSAPPSGGYGPYPPQGYPPPQQPYPSQGSGYPPPQQPYPPQQPVYYQQPVYMPPPKRGGGFCAGLGVGLLLVVICLCAVGAYWQQDVTKRNRNATATAVGNYNQNVNGTAYARLTPTPYNESDPPSNKNFSGKAQSILTNAQIASEVYDDKQPSKITSTFNTYQKIYLTFKLTPGNTGYAMSKLYFNGAVGNDSQTIPLEGRQGYGNFSVDYRSVGEGAFELYWCADEGCNSRELAWVRTFRVR